MDASFEVEQVSKLIDRLVLATKEDAAAHPAGAAPKPAAPPPVAHAAVKPAAPAVKAGGIKVIGKAASAVPAPVAAAPPPVWPPLGGASAHAAPKPVGSHGAAQAVADFVKGHGIRSLKVGRGAATGASGRE